MTEKQIAKKKQISGNEEEIDTSQHGSTWSSSLIPLLNRYGWDAFGVLIIVVALLSFFGLVGWTSGSFIDFWSGTLQRWVGWGSYGFVALLIVLALWIFRRRATGEMNFPLARVICLEIAFFFLLALFSISGNVDLPRAESGTDGGIIGWGLANLFLRFLPETVAVILLIIFSILFLAIGFGLINGLIKLLDRLTGILLRNSDGSNSNSIYGNLRSSADPLASRQGKTNSKQAQNSVFSTSILERNQTLPPFELLAKEQVVLLDDQQVRTMGLQIEHTLDEFGIPARVAGYRIGPTVTQFAVEPGFVEKEAADGSISKHKVRVSQISSLAKDLALALSAERLRVEAPVPGQSYVGIEVPNPQSKIVRLRPILESDQFHRINSPLALALGQDVSGQPVAADLSKMPHLLIAGTTGSGKSVCVSAMTACLLMNNSPQDLRIAMLDPKMVELVRFNGVPHLLGKVETAIDRMIAVLQWAITEMDMRYRMLEEARARDLDAYNLKMSRKNQITLPRIVIMIDELADLMMSSPEQTEHSLVRLAQMARAVGIHLVVATQRPSTDVVTGLIKANFPARISFTVASSIDSRVVLDMNGAETLLGKGDMLYLAPDIGAPQRAQGVFVTDQEIENIIHYWQNADSSADIAEAPWEGMMKVMEEDTDTIVKQAIQLVRTSQRASASLLQRRLRIGFPRAARLLDQLEEMGVVGPSQGGGRDREVMIDPDDDWDDIETDPESEFNS